MATVGGAAPLAGVAIVPILGTAMPVGHLAAAILVVVALLRPILMVAGPHLLARSAYGVGPQVPASFSLTLSFCEYKKEKKISNTLQKGAGIFPAFPRKKRGGGSLAIVHCLGLANCQVL